ncbi:MAG TPA: MFS transporter [Candidatus Acidoferrales bacterium]
MERVGPSPQADVSSHRATALLHVGFVLTGMVTTLLGPILPALSARWSLPDSQAGYLFTSQFVGSMTGVALLSAFLPRWGFRSSLILGFGMMAGGVGALGLGSWPIGLISVFCYGIGLGVTIPATNLLVSEASPHRRAAALNILNLAWGMGAVAFPPVTALFQRTSGVHVLLFALGAALGLMAICLAPVSFFNVGNRPSQASPPFQPQVSVWRSRFLPILGLLFFLYVGTESALGGWVAFYAKSLSPTPGTVWLITPSFFWGALLLGRALAPAVLRHVAEAKLVVMGLVMAALGVTLLLAAGSLAGVLSGVSIAGLGLASVFPITVALLSHSFGELASRVAGAMFALGAMGGATLPWLVGFLSTHFGSLNAGLVVPLLGSLVMVALHLSHSRSRTGGALQFG